MALLPLDCRAPGCLWLLGEKGIGLIRCEQGTDSLTLDRIRRAFPEAIVITEDQEIPPQFLD